MPPTDIRFKEGLNGTALTLAARNGHMEVATLLLDAGANELVGDDGESTPLLHAVSHGRAAIVRTLSAKRAARQGAVLNELDKSGHTPLQRAAMAGQGPSQQGRTSRLATAASSAGTRPRWAR